VEFLYTHMWPPSPTSRRRATSSSSGGAKVSEILHFEAGRQTAGPDPQRSSYGSFVSFRDPDGNAWMVQEVRRSEPPA
jgi:hypothetical protein